MVSFPPCKINLGLHVIEKRPDGYHNLETCFYPVPWTDILEIFPSNAFSFTSSGAEIPGDAGKNLCVQAYDLLKKDFTIPPVRIHLHKVIPTGSGLGGGSSDGSHTLRLLNEMFELKLTPKQLSGYASQLGSDCAFFLQDEPQLAKGRGEILDGVYISLKGKFLLIVKPDVHVSTAEAYAGIRPKRPDHALMEVLDRLTLNEWKSFLKNDFEPTVFQKYPSIEAAKQKLYSLGAIYASMSGSGAAVFGIFEKPVVIPEEYKANSWGGTI